MGPSASWPPARKRESGSPSGPVTITRDTIFHGTVTGDVTVLGGVHLDLLGTVLGNLLVEDSGTACVRGVVAEAVINRGGVFEILRQRRATSTTAERSSARRCKR